jgi:hypothetical protein
MQKALGDNAFDEATAEREAREAERAALEVKKANQRVAVSGLLSAVPGEIRPIGQKLEIVLENLETEMKSFAQNTLVSNLEGGFKGKTASAAASHLKNLPIPAFNNPVKG